MIQDDFQVIRVQTNKYQDISTDQRVIERHSQLCFALLTRGASFLQIFSGLVHRRCQKTPTTGQQLDTFMF